MAEHAREPMHPATARKAHHVDGVLLLDKPVGLTSNAALQRARRALGAAKAGHTGTLDPLASGLLPLCLGEATKFARFLLDADKRYVATVRFGTTTTTQDGEGEVVATSSARPERADIVAALPRFRGTILQVPPAHSALKHRGRSHYEYARAGIDVPREAREVHISTLELLEWASPDATLDVACSKGTYVRALAADLGTALGCGAHLAALRRTATGGYRVDDAIALAVLEAMPAEARTGVLRPVDALLAGLPLVALDPAAAAALRHGQEVEDDAGPAGLVRVYDREGALIGVAERRGARLATVRLLATNDAH